jgi:dTDP-4-amino-4,6-dideoxygalactose transaminase
MSIMTTQIPINDLLRRFGPLQAELGAAFARVIGSGRYILGELCEKFEADFARYVGAKHCIGVANGTDALELALRAVGVAAGARVATVANAGMYGTTAILAVGATPVFIDIDPNTLTMSPQALAAAGPVDAVLVVHLYGRMADMPALTAAARGAVIIEDCAQSHGAVLQGRPAGSWGSAACFSFYPTKNLGALGDGGAVVTSDSNLATRLRRLRQYGWSSRYYAELPGGRNSRLDEMQGAALGVMLPRLDRWNARRQQIAERYNTAFAGNEFSLPSGAKDEHVFHLYVLRTEARDALKAHLAGAGIGVDVHYPLPDYRQPAVTAVIRDLVPLPETERAVTEILTIPCFPELTDPEVDAVIAAVRSFRA